MAVPVRDEHWPVGNDRVEALLVRRSTRKGVHRPATARDPFPFRVLGCVAGYRVEAFLRGLGLVEVALDRQEASVRRMHVGVLEAR
jgi:hypothetical protein